MTMINDATRSVASGLTFSGLAISGRRLVLAGMLAAGGFSLSGGGALAHAALRPAEAVIGATWSGAVRIGHGCNGAATRLVRVAIPDGVVAVRPRDKKGWLIETTWAPYAKPVEIHGKKVTEGVKSIIWKGAVLHDHLFDDFEFLATITPDAAADDGKLRFPVYQECENSTLEWIETPAAGGNARDLKRPAPSLTLVAAPGKAQHASTSAAQAGASLAVSGGWTRATPAGAKVAGAYVAIANGGGAEDVLLGGKFDVAGKVEVHDMTMQDGVMRMRHLEKGLPVPAGGSVELRPGGLHLMLMGLKQPLKQGATIRGVLTFRDAGDIEVALPVEAAGSPGPAAGRQDHQHEDHDHGGHDHH